MKIRITITLVVLVVLASALTGCGPKQDNYLTEILKILPDDIISVEYSGVELLAEDSDLEDIYNDLTESIFGSMVYLLGLDFSDIHAIIVADDADEYKSGLWVIRGDFDFQNVRDALTEYPEHEFVQDEFEGVEFWIGDPDSGEPLAIALLEKVLVLGDADYVKDAVHVSTNEKSSVYDNKDMKSVVDKLSAGIQAEIYIGEAVYGIPALAGGTVIFNSIDGDGIVNAEGWYKFGSAADAQAALPDLQESYYWWSATNIDAQLKGEFIEITGEMEISKY